EPTATVQPARSPTPTAGRGQSGAALAAVPALPAATATTTQVRAPATPTRSPTPASPSASPTPRVAQPALSVVQPTPTADAARRAAPMATSTQSPVPTATPTQPPSPTATLTRPPATATAPLPTPIPEPDPGPSPVWPAYGPITTYFGEVGPYSPRGHAGIDIAAPWGAPVVATEAGHVVLAAGD